MTDFYARTLRVCVNCATAWEPFNVADVQHPEERNSAFREPCGNCAFRPGSPEQQDKARWRDLMDGLKAGSSFYCHKGVPIDLKHEHGDSGFAYPDRGANPRKLRLCRGYLNTLAPRIARMIEANQDDDHDHADEKGLLDPPG